MTKESGIRSLRIPTARPRKQRVRLLPGGTGTAPLRHPPPTGHRVLTGPGAWPSIGRVGQLTLPCLQGWPWPPSLISTFLSRSAQHIARALPQPRPAQTISPGGEEVGVLVASSLCRSRLPTEPCLSGFQPSRPSPGSLPSLPPSGSARLTLLSQAV